MNIFLQRRTFSLVLTGVISVSVIVGLYLLAEVPNTYKNGFERNISSLSGLEPDYFKNIKADNKYIMGHTSYSVFLSDYQDTRELIITNNHFTEIQQYTLSAPKKGLTFMNQVDSPLLYSFSLKDSNIQIYHLFSDKINLTDSCFHIQKNFNQALSLNRSSYFIRASDTSRKQNVLYKISISEQKYLPEYILQKQGDGYFSTDGNLLYDNYSMRLIYIYFYRNQFLVFDTLLNPIATGNTIDTNRSVKLNIREAPSIQLYTFSKPPVIINQKSSVYDGRLYIKSGLLADNENRQAFSKSSIIDIYDLYTTKYINSFYIPAFDGYKLHDFIITEHGCIALQGPFIVHYPFLPNISHIKKAYEVRENP